MSRGSAVAAALALWWGTAVPLPWWTAAAGVVLLLAVAVAGHPRLIRSTFRGAASGRRDGSRAARQSVRATTTSGPAARRRLLVVLGALWLAGAGLAGGRSALRDSGPLTAQSTAADAHMVVVTEPRPGPFDAWMVVRVERFGSRRVRQRALLRAREPPPIGARLQAQARVGALPDGPFGAYLQALGAAVEVRPLGTVSVSRPPGRVLRSTSVLRDRLRSAAVAGLPPDHAALLTGLVTGDGRGRSSDLDDLLTRAGLRHLVVVSGRHTALFLAGVLGIAVLCRASFRTARLAALAALTWFVVLVRWQPSVLRAATVAAVILVADLLGRDRDHVHLLAMAVTVLLLIDPLLGRQLGFVLSVAATAGVLLLAPMVSAWLRGPPWWRIGVGAAVGAQVAVAPVLVVMDEAVPLGGVMANLIAAPAAAAAQVVGTVAALVAVPAPALSAVVARLAVWPLSVILWAAEIAGRVPDAQALLNRPGIVAAIGAAMIGVIVGRRVAGPRRWAAVVACVLVAAVALAPRSAPPIDVLTVTMLDVGQGDAVLVEAPADVGTARMLVDGGPADADVAAVLARRGVRTLDVVVATHAHADHTGGLPAVLRGTAVGTVVTAPPADRPGTPGGSQQEPDTAGGSDQARGMARVMAAVRGRGLAHVPLAAGAVFDLGTARVHILSPPTATPGWDENDRSLVLRVDGAYGSVLLTGDVEADGQRPLLTDPEALRADVVKVPHHGGATNARDFIGAVGATVALTSVGAGNDYGHPAPSVLADLGGTTNWRSDVHGTVRVELRPRGPRVSSS